MYAAIAWDPVAVEHEPSAGVSSEKLLGMA
jgi:hypothetical protein